MGKFLNRMWVLAIIVALVAGCAKKPPPEPEPEPAPPPVVQPEPEPQPQGPTEEELRQQRMRDAIQQAIEPVYFGYDKSALTSEAKTTLSNIGDVMKQYSEISLRIEGHADERGTDEYNFALGERRASAVKNYLSTYGVDENRMTTVSYGENRPAVEGTGEDVWSKNRRVEFQPSF